MSDILILLVEDNPADISRIKEYLLEKNTVHFDLKEAESLGAAFSLLSHYDFDVVLLDLVLPDSSGLDTARRIITKYPETAVIVLTNSEEEETARQAVRYGAEDWLDKTTLSSAMLAKSVAYAIERKKLIMEKYDILSDLVLALDKIESLENVLPICAGCKKIYHEDKHWLTLEEFTDLQSGIRTHHPLCPDCKQNIENNL